MFSKKRIVVAMVAFCSLIAIAVSPAAAYDIDITISGLSGLDLAAFDLNVNYDDTLLTFEDYTLTGQLGSFSSDAEDWSFGDDGFGTVNLSILSYLMDFSAQSDAFTLATISFSGDESAMAAISLSDIILSEPAGNAIAYAVAGTDISAVPVPGAIWLMGSGLLGFAGLIRRRRAPLR